jgi:hypothetical protein
MKKLITYLIISFLLAACSNSGGGSGGEEGGKSPAPSNPNGCPVAISGGATNLEIAQAFHHWRLISNPTEAELKTALDCSF